MPSYNRYFIDGDVFYDLPHVFFTEIYNILPDGSSKRVAQMDNYDLQKTINVSADSIIRLDFIDADGTRFDNPMVLAATNTPTNIVDENGLLSNKEIRIVADENYKPSDEYECYLKCPCEMWLYSRNAENCVVTCQRVVIGLSA